MPLKRMIGTNNDHRWMRYALELAHQARDMAEVPVGAVLVHEQELFATGYNQTISTNDTTAHAEVVAIRNACSKLKNYRLPNTTLYVTLEPCCMCAGALVHARVSRVVYAARDPKTGAAGSVFSILDSKQHNHQIQVDQGPFTEESQLLLQSFFKDLRNKHTAYST